MKKILIIIFSLVIFSLSIQCQEIIKLFYNADWRITKEDKAVYYRESIYDLNNFKLEGKVKDYTLSGNLIMEGNYQEGIRNGYFVFYYNNTRVKCEGEYKNNKRFGKWKYYYNNGVLKQVVLFNDINNKYDISVIEYYDKDGNQLIVNGTGYWLNDSIQMDIFDSESFKRLRGEFKDSLKHGEWKLYRNSDNELLHTERFRNGKYISGSVYFSKLDLKGIMPSEDIDKLPDENNLKLSNTESFKLDTTVYSDSLFFSGMESVLKTITGREYKIQNREAVYIYGEASLFEFIGMNIQYPINVREKGISGKVYVRVEIDSLGMTKNVSIAKGVHKDLDNEAIRVLRLVNQWMPAIKNGQASESSIVIPINFRTVIKN